MNERIQPLAIQTYIKLAQNKDLISFAAGMPDLSVLPLQQLKKMYGQFAQESSDISFQYQAPSQILKQKIQTMMADKSVPCNLDEILIINGAQQGIFLTANLWFKEKASLMIDEFVYPGFLQVANLFNLNYLPIPSVFNEGIDLNYLESILKTKKTLPYLYIVCNGHNPQSLSYNTKLRRELALLAEQYDFIIIEDDPYGYLSFTDEAFLPMRAYTKNAIYMSSFSKILAPALRTGWIVGDKDIIDKLEQLKDMNDLYSSNPSHLVINLFLESYSLPRVVQPQINLYKNKLDSMILALNEHMTVDFKYTAPRHGMFLWIEFSNINIEHHKKQIFEKSKVLFIPGSAFATNNYSRKQAIRLNFTYPSFEDIELGVKQLGTALREFAPRLAINSPKQTIQRASYGNNYSKKLIVNH